MSGTAKNLQGVRDRIRTAVEHAQRGADTVRLIAVTKTFPADRVLEAIAAGQTVFGENYVQEGVAKIAAVAAATALEPESTPEWHFIGPIQSNKTRLIAERFDWVHGIDRLKIAERLSDQRPAHLGPLSVLIEVNVDGEDSKSGVAPEDVAALAVQVAALPRLKFVGLMAVPRPRDDVAGQRAAFRRVRELLATLGAHGLDCTELSMGMSADLEAAIAEGATMVRVGTAIFGTRPVKEESTA